MPRDITAFFERYRDAFNALEGAAVAELYAEPSAIAQGGTYTHWPTRTAVRENMAALCEFYREKSYGRADFEATSFISQGDRYAIADLRWRIEWNSTEEPWLFNTTYNLVRTDQGWKVLLCTAYQEDKLVKEAGAA
jgi:ketosteroid isomerase-like protein